MKKSLLYRTVCILLILAMLSLTGCRKVTTVVSDYVYSEIQGTEEPEVSEETGKTGESTESNVSEQQKKTAKKTNLDMPTANLSKNSKVLKVFGWSTMAENNTDGEAAEYFKKEFGVKIEDTIATHETYWETLAKMVSAGNAPDVVDLSYDKFYPTPVSEGLLEPWDGLIDFDEGIWSDTKEIIEEMKWKDKVYFPIFGEFLQSWVYYNTNMFKKYGLENMTPRALYERDEWTLDKLLELSDKFIEKNNKNEIVQWGFTPQNLEPLSISGVQIVEIKQGKSYKNNLRDPKIAKVMNAFYKISSAGSGSMSVLDACPLFEQEKVAMLFSHADLTIQRRFENLRQAGSMGFAPMPKLDKDSKYNMEVSMDPGYGLIKGAKNKELAALWVKYVKWFRLGENFCAEFPRDTKTPAGERYHLKAKAGSGTLSKEDKEFVQKFLDSKPTKVYTTYRSIVRNFGELLELYKWQIFAGHVQWSAVVQQMNPIYESRLKNYIK